VIAGGSSVADVAPVGAVVAVAVIFGLIIGSFLNVAIYRVPRGLSVIQPRSFCPSCRTPIQPLDNVPVLSWLVLRGRCRRCGESISVRYPAVEAATAALFGATAWALHGHWGVPGMCALAATMLVLVIVVLDGDPPSGAIALVGTATGVVLLAAAAAADGRWWHLGGMLIGAAVGLAVVAATAHQSPVARAVRHGRAAPLASSPIPLPWAVVPAGATFGWFGVAGTVVGGPVTVVVAFAVAALVRRTRRRGRPVGAVAVTVAAAAGCVAAVIGALVAGGPIGA
jgi:leader peptidase (prepilin peptidase) / N-methyltransferase